VLDSELLQCNSSYHSLPYCAVCRQIPAAGQAMCVRMYRHVGACYVTLLPPEQVLGPSGGCLGPRRPSRSGRWDRQGAPGGPRGVSATRHGYKNSRSEKHHRDAGERAAFLVLRGSLQTRDNPVGVASPRSQDSCAFRLRQRSQRGRRVGVDDRRGVSAIPRFVQQAGGSSNVSAAIRGREK